MSAISLMRFAVWLLGGFVFGALVAWLLATAGRVVPQDGSALRATA